MRQAIRFAGENLIKILDEAPPEKLKKLRTLWENRISAVRDNALEHKKELASFGWWFVSGKFDDNWSIVQLKKVLSLIGNIEPDDMVINCFEGMMGKMPLDVLECLILIVKGDAEGWRISYWKERLKGLISSAINMDKEVRQKAIELLNILGAKGFLEFRELLPD